MFAVAVPVVGSIGHAGLTSKAVLLTATFFAGFFVLGIQSGINAIGALVYPTSLRANGSGWELGIGRIGSIFWASGRRTVNWAAGREALYVVGTSLRRRRGGLLCDSSPQHRALGGSAGIA
jgi:hypothetical protein